MILKPLLTFSAIRPPYYTPVKTTRSLRPTIKIGKDRFQLTLNVRQFNKDELKVKAHPEYVTIEGKQEKNTAQGYLLRQFVRKFKLPDGCEPSKIESRLSTDGVLTIVAPRASHEASLPLEPVSVPINYGKDDRKQIQVEAKPDERVGPGAPYCSAFPKVKARPK
ncbi:protein lethal(2)essential for life-like [Trichoplusia ni]|uniref:Protein lethal(2)essential for life-like n=1 Tax=Trichoplusia ni TaxID=7111 RepID=A0A7E5W021_TRINI|nr:protein lethal(2)essential for life-like [Trichoplusia ni]